MSEADTPNNQPLPEPTGSADDSTADLPDAAEISEYPQIVNLSELAYLKEVVQPPRQEETIELLGATAASSTTPEADELDTEMPEATERRTKDADWFVLAQKMRQRNRRLLDQVTQLRQALREKQEELHSELLQSRDRETLVTQQAEELNTAQEQLTRMFHALESSHQASQRQQILIETLSEQLQSSQERIAQLERECALTQQRYNEQSHQLLQAANTCRELRTRLQRQQRQTLQFKTALEKSLEMSTPGNSVVQQQPQQRSSVINPSTVSKAQPIKPWSADPELVEDKSSFDTIWSRPVKLEPPSVVYSSEAVPFEIKRSQDIDRPALTDNFEPTETQDVASQESSQTEQELEQQLLAEMTFLAEASGLSEFSSDLAEAEAPLLLEPGTNPDESDEVGLSITDAEEPFGSEDTDEIYSEAQTPNEDVWEEDSTNRELDESDVILPQSNWPSPTLYPLRPPKKRKSLAAIDLPNFPRFRPT